MNAVYVHVLFSLSPSPFPFPLRHIGPLDMCKPFNSQIHTQTHIGTLTHYLPRCRVTRQHTYTPRINWTTCMKFISICTSFIVRSFTRFACCVFFLLFFLLSARMHAYERTESCCEWHNWMCIDIQMRQIQTTSRRTHTPCICCGAALYVAINACHNSQQSRKRDESAEWNCEREAKNEWKEANARRVKKRSKKNKKWK